MGARLETYLEEVAASLRPLPAKRRGEELREMHGHLEAAFETELRRGRSTEEAARGARAQFGAADEVGAETVAAWRRGRSLDRRSFWGATAFALFVPFFAWNLMVMVEQTYFERWNVGPNSGSIPDWAIAVLLATTLLSPVLRGGLVGFLFPRLGRARLGIAVGVSGVLLCFLTGFIPTTLIHVPISMFSGWAVSRWRRRRLERTRVAQG